MIRKILAKTRIKKYLLFMWRGRWWHKSILILSALVIAGFGSMYGIAEWYIHKHQNDPLKLGATFIAPYAKELGLDPQETLSASINDLGIKNFRLVSYWDQIETSPGVYDFSGLDWQFDMADKAGAKVSLAIGLRQPRWPECHQPSWTQNQPMEVWYPQLKEFMKRTINHYKDRTSLESYQLENEFFLSVFGICPDFSRDRLVDEYKYVKTLDSQRPVVVSRSNNWVGVPIGEPEPDMYGISVYKRVWDGPHTKRYAEYPLPPWYYATLAGASEILTGKNMQIHELQAEVWLPAGFDIKTAPLSEQRKSLDAKKLQKRFAYAEETGIKSIDLWGLEYWYYVKVQLNDPSLWNVAKQEFKK